MAHDHAIQFASLLEPTSSLHDYIKTRRPSKQSDDLPSVFIDAMIVRTAVFVDEQSVPLEFEFDSDDPRSCHWVAYASVIHDPEAQVKHNALSSKTVTSPTGTIRLVPFPHDPHPQNGDEYIDAQLVNRLARLPSDEASNATTFHDGTEPYVKLGRLAVLPDCRGHDHARLLVRTALDWIKSHASYFDPTVASVSLDQLNALDKQQATITQWKGLVCVHTQKTVMGFWQKNGFEVDPAMGEWKEEDITHVGMFQRLAVR